MKTSSHNLSTVSGIRAVLSLLPLEQLEALARTRVAECRSAIDSRRQEMASNGVPLSALDGVFQRCKDLDVERQAAADFAVACQFQRLTEGGSVEAAIHSTVDAIFADLDRSDFGVIRARASVRFLMGLARHVADIAKEIEGAGGR